jgi:putative salt-induced outer membrane protein
MSLRNLVCLLSALTLSPSLVAADQVTLKNGDRITGQIVKKDGDKLTVKSELMGEVTIPWSAVTAITSSEPLVVVLPGGKSVTGSLSASEGKVQVTTSGGTETAPLADVSAVRNAAEQQEWERLQHPSLSQLWKGYADLGLALTRGNARTTSLTTAFRASRETKADKIALHFDEISASADISGETVATARAIRGGVSYNRNVGPRLFIDLFNDYEYDKFQDLDLRFLLGGGLGYNATKSDRVQLGLVGGVNYDRARFSTDLTRNSADAYFGDDLSYRLSGLTSVHQSFRVYPNLSQTGDYRIDFDIGAVTTLKKWLGWQVTASDRFLSDPVAGRKRNDVLLTTGFRVSFAR